MTERNTWDQLDKETAAQWQGFRIYRDLGPNRSLQKAWETYANERGLQTTHMSSSFKDWSRFNNWINRSKAWDAAQDEIKQAIRLRARDMARQIAAEQAVDVVKNLARIASGMQIDLEEGYAGDRVSEQYIIQAAKLLLDIADVKSPTRLEVGGKALVLQARVDELDQSPEDAEALINDYMKLTKGTT